MIIVVDCTASPGVTRLEEQTDCTRLHVVIQPADASPDAVAEAIDGIATLDEDRQHLFIRRDSLVALARDPEASQEWIDEVDAMFAYAARNGWVDQDGAVQAHIES